MNFVKCIHQILFFSYESLTTSQKLKTWQVQDAHLRLYLGTEMEVFKMKSWCVPKSGMNNKKCA